MQREGNMPEAEGNEQQAREYFRHPSIIPATVGIAHTWEGSTGTNLPADLINLSCGGASLRVCWVFPPRTRLHVSFSAHGSAVSHLAEVVWTSLLPGRRPEPAVYGIRWIERLTRSQLESLLTEATASRAGEDAGGSPH